MSRQNRCHGHNGGFTPNRNQMPANQSLLGNASKPISIGSNRDRQLCAMYPRNELLKLPYFRSLQAWDPAKWNSQDMIYITKQIDASGNETGVRFGCGDLWNVLYFVSNNCNVLPNSIERLESFLYCLDYCNSEIKVNRSSSSNNNINNNKQGDDQQGKQLVSHKVTKETVIQFFRNNKSNWVLKDFHAWSLSVTHPLLREALMELDIEYTNRLKKAKEKWGKGTKDDTKDKKSRKLTLDELRTIMKTTKIDAKTASKLFEDAFELDVHFVANKECEIKVDQQLPNHEDLSKLMIQASCAPFIVRKAAKNKQNSNGNSSNSNSSKSNSSNNSNNSNDIMNDDAQFYVQDILMQAGYARHFSKETFGKIDQLVEALLQQTTICCPIKVDYEAADLVDLLLLSMHESFTRNIIQHNDPRLIGLTFINRFNLLLSRVLFQARFERVYCSANQKEWLHSKLGVTVLERIKKGDFDSYAESIIKIAEMHSSKIRAQALEGENLLEYVNRNVSNAISWRDCKLRCLLQCSNNYLLNKQFFKMWFKDLNESLRKNLQKIDDKVKQSTINSNANSNANNHNDDIDKVIGLNHDWEGDIAKHVTGANGLFAKFSCDEKFELALNLMDYYQYDKDDDVPFPKEYQNIMKEVDIDWIKFQTIAS